jgi:hypothetical protein
MKQHDDQIPAPINEKSVPKTNAIRLFHQGLFVVMLAILVVLGLELLLSRFCNDQVVVKSFQVGRVILSLLWVTGWICYEAERKSQFISKRFWRTQGRAVKSAGCVDGILRN